MPKIGKRSLAGIVSVAKIASKDTKTQILIIGAQFLITLLNLSNIPQNGRLQLFLGQGVAVMARIIVLSNDNLEPPLPALGLMSHSISYLPAEAAALVNAPSHDLTLLDGRSNLSEIKSLAQLLHSAGRSRPLILVCGEGMLTTLNPDWHVDDFVLTSAGPAEIEARIRLALEKTRSNKEMPTGLHIDEASYSAKINGRSLDLTFKEFELLRYLADHSGQVLTREQLLSEVWGYDYFGGTRTVDVHIRRLRAKLGEMESLITTVRNVGYMLTKESRAKSEANSNTE
jgi:DNA-binding response OmpR family regulator